MAHQKIMLLLYRMFNKNYIFAAVLLFSVILLIIAYMLDWWGTSIRDNENKIELTPSVIRLMNAYWGRIINRGNPDMNYCLDIGGTGDVGDQIILNPCDDTLQTQYWTLTNDGLLKNKANEYCAQIIPDAYNKDKNLFLYPCSTGNLKIQALTIKPETTNPTIFNVYNEFYEGCFEPDQGGNATPLGSNSIKVNKCTGDKDLTQQWKFAEYDLK